MIAPRVISIRNELCSGFVINRNNITLQVLLIPIYVPFVDFIISIVVLHTDGRVLRVVNVDGYVSVSFLGDYLRAVEIVGSDNAALVFRGSDSVIVIGKRIAYVVLDCACKLPARPRE